MFFLTNTVVSDIKKRPVIKQVFALGLCVLCTISFIFSCNDSTDENVPPTNTNENVPPTNTNENVLTANTKKELLKAQQILQSLGEPENYYELVSDSENPSDIIVVYLPGGPIPILVTSDLDHLRPHYNVAYIYQAQNFNPNILKTGNDDQALKERLFSMEKAHEYNLYSVAYAVHVIKHFKRKRMTVYLASHSFGAFVTQKMISLFGNIADKAIISGAKLDTLQELVDATKNGYIAGGYNDEATEYDKESWYHVTNAPSDQTFGNPLHAVWNAMRLFSSIATPRYSQLFNKSNVGNLLYVHGYYDTQVGRMSQREVDLLKKIGVISCQIVDSHNLKKFFEGEKGAPYLGIHEFFKVETGTYPCPPFPNPIPPAPTNDSFAPIDRTCRTCRINISFLLANHTSFFSEKNNHSTTYPRSFK